MEAILEQVRDYADQAHGTQMRKYTPERYIVHPVRVMELCRPYDASLPVLAAALLHDVLEDTPVTREAMHRFLHMVMSPGDADRTLQLVVELTDVYIKSSYPEWNRKKRKQKETERLSHASAAAQTIKYADILDNCKEIAAHDPQFAPRFLRECGQLLRMMTKGDPGLYQRAKETVSTALDHLGPRPPRSEQH